MNSRAYFRRSDAVLTTSRIAKEISAETKGNDGTSILLILFNLGTTVLPFVSTFAVLQSFFG